MYNSINRKLWIKSKVLKYLGIISFRGKQSSSDIYNKLYVVDRIYNHPKFDWLDFHDLHQISIGSYVEISSTSWIWCHDNWDSGPCVGKGRGSISIGSNTRIGPRFHADCYDEVIIGADCLFAEDVLILTANHGMNPEMQGNYVEQPFSTGKVIIRDGCWLGSRVSVLAGVTIGKRCIIGTNSVVTNDIPPFSIAAGIPARVIKRWNFETHKWDRV